MPFYKFACSYVILYNIQNAWCLFCLIWDYWFEIINYNMQYMCYKSLACESKMASIFNSGQFSGLSTELPTISILESSGLPTELHIELPIISIYGSSGQPFLHGKIPMGSPWAAHSTTHWAVHFFFIFGSSWLPPISIYGSSGQPYLHGKIPKAAHSAAHWTAHFLIFGSSGLPTELPTVSIYGSSGQPNLHGKIPIGSQRAAHSVAHVQPMGSEVGSSPVFPYGI